MHLFLPFLPFLTQTKVSLWLEAPSRLIKSHIGNCKVQENNPNPLTP